MNKLYAIEYMLPNEYVISVWHGWTEEAASREIKKNPEWTFILKVDNECHKIWKAV